MRLEQRHGGEGHRHGARVPSFDLGHEVEQRGARHVRAGSPLPPRQRVHAVADAEAGGDGMPDMPGMDWPDMPGVMPD